MSILDTYIDSGKVTMNNDKLNMSHDVFIEIMSHLNQNTKTKKKQKDPTKPKRPTSAYLLWLSEKRDSIKKQYFSDINDFDESKWTIEFKKEYYSKAQLDEPKSGWKIGKPRIVALVTAKAGKIWNEISEEEKQPYIANFLEAQKVYITAKKEHSTKKTNETVLNQTNEIDEIEVEGFDKPHKMKYIEKTIKDEDGKTIKLFKTFREAYEKAMLLGKNCYGITQTKRGYSVRDGRLVDTPIDNPSKGLMSWTKTGFVEKKKSKRGRPSGSHNKKKKQNIITDSSDDESYEIPENKSTPIKDEESDNEMDISEINYEGEKYLVSSEGDVYDPDTADIVGKFINNKIEFN